MAAKSRELQRQWWDWLSTGERLLRSLTEQTVALIKRDVSSVERIQPELDSMLERMRLIDEQAAATTRRLAEQVGCDPNVRSLAAVLGPNEGNQLVAIANRVKIVGANIRERLAKNEGLIESELIYVSGTLSLIAKAAADQPGPYARPEAGAVLLNEVA